MASYRKHTHQKHGRKTTTWTATVRIPEHYNKPVLRRSYSDTFATRRLAEKWATETEADIARGIWEDPRLRVIDEQEIPTLHDALNVYFERVTKNKKGWKQELNRIKKWQNHPIAKKRIDRIRRRDIALWAEERIAEGRARTTITNDLQPLEGCMRFHIALLDLQIENPVKAYRDLKILPKGRGHRSRRLQEGEEEAMLAALGDGLDGQEMQVIFTLAIESGMRLGEMLSIKREWLDKQQQTVRLPDTKNDDARTVYLSSKAMEALERLPYRLNGKLFSLNADQVEWRWRKAREAAGCKDLRFHDLRHEACSRMDARGIPLKIIMMQSGHRSIEAVSRYLNPTAEEARKALTA